MRNAPDPVFWLDPKQLCRIFSYQNTENGWSHNSPPRVLSSEEKRKLLESTSLSSANNTMRTLGKMLKMYWTQSGKKEIALATGLAATTLGMSALNVDILVQYSDWYREFIDIFQSAAVVISQNADSIKESLIAADPSLANDATRLKFEHGKAIAELPAIKEKYDDLINKLTIDFPIIVGKYLATALAAFTSAQHLSLRWRSWITGKFTNEWMNNKAFFKLKNVYNNIDNPDQRIQEDLDKLTDGMVSITTEGMQSTLSLAAFGTLLYTSFGAFNPATIGGPDITINGYLFWAAVAYAAVGTAALAAVTKKLPDIYRRKQVAEGNFRAGLISVHKNAEQISLNKGEDIEKNILRKKFRNVVQVTKEYINTRKKMILVNSIHSNLGTTIPYIASAPLFFTGQITFGAISQTAYAFKQVENSFSFFMNNLQFFASMKANTDRLGTLLNAIEISHADSAEQKIYNKQTKPGF